MRVATSTMLSVIIASCHRSKNQMPARQTTVDDQRPAAAEHEGEGAQGGRGHVPRRLREQVLHRVEQHRW